MSPKYLDPVFLKQKYLDERLSTAQIAGLVFSARSTVAKYLKRYGIPLRPEDEAHALRKGQMAFGEHTRKGKLKAHQRELAAIERMKTLRAKGYSYHKIAEVLTALKVPTKNGRHRWHATTVMKILKAQDAREQSVFQAGE